MTRDTTTGKDLEDMAEIVITRLAKKLNYTYKSQEFIGIKPGGGRHIIDHLMVKSNGEKLLISCKTQSTSGTAQEKLPYEAIKLLHAINTDQSIKGAIILLSGNGWSTDMLDFVKKDIYAYIPQLQNNNIRYMDINEFVSWNGVF